MATAAIGAGLGAVGDLLGGIFGSNAAQDAAGVLTGYFGANAAQEAGVGQQQLRYELNGLTPYLNAGQQGEGTLRSLLSTPGQGLLQGYNAPLPQFQQPTGVNFQNDPGYQFRLQQGENALQNSAAARGDLLSGNTMTALTNYGQNLGSEEYGNVYNRALQNYQAQLQSYGTGANTFYQNQANQFNRLMGLGSQGMQATGMQNQARQAYQNQYDQAMNLSNSAGAAKAAGIMGSGNAWQNALGGMFGNAMSALGPLGGMLGAGGGGAGAQISPSVLQSLPLAAPSGSAAYGLGSAVNGGGFGIGGYGQGYPGNASGY